MLPGAAAFAFAGHGGRAALGGESDALGWALGALGLLAALALLPGLLRRGRSPTMTSVDELRSRLAAADAPLVLDVRSMDEFEGPLGHVPGAVCVPIEQLDGRARELRADGRGVVTVCLTDRRSTRAALQLLDAGLHDVTVLAGGMKAWNESATNRVSKEAAS